VVSAVLTLSLLEVAFRARAALVNRGAGGSRPGGAARPSPRSAVKLGQIIRPASSRRVYELLPDLDVVFLNAELHTNPHGFRGPDAAPEKGAGEIRILGLGDSVMFGWGVDYVDAYLARLAGRLGRERPERQWTILNTAVPGYNTVMEVETLKEKGLAYGPDLVVLNVVGNDLGLPNFVLRGPDLFSPRQSFLLEFVKGRLGYAPDAASSRLEGVPPAQRRWWTGGDLAQVPPALRDLAGLPAFRRAMADLAALGREKGFETVVIAHPEAPDFAREAAATHGFLLVETKSAVVAYAESHGLAEIGAPPLTLTAADPHPSALGHGVIADVLYERLNDAGLFEALARGADAKTRRSTGSMPPAGAPAPLAPSAAGSN